jgi:ABC-type multidrug transport system ATPase subunit
VQYHLEFFAYLKGLPSSKVRQIAASMAKAVGFGAPEVYSRHSGQLSGGMRRRLSIAISLIGAPKVLLLDEPSTGLDPSTRNSIWKLVNSFATKERAVIITTHMMLEADILCSRIAIMSQGTLKVIATQQALKDRFESGCQLQINLVKTTPEDEDKAMQFVRQHLHKDAVLQTKEAKTLHIALPRDIDLTAIFRALYSSETAKEGGINQFLLSQSSLETSLLLLVTREGGVSPRCM